MRCLVMVKFLTGGSMSPEEFFHRIGAQWSWVDYVPSEVPEKAGGMRPGGSPKAREAICITDYESIEQLTTDLSIMPGAGISTVEVCLISENLTDVHSLRGVCSV